MKKIITLLFVIMQLASINAQPRITVANLMQVGDTTIMIRFDTTGTIHEGPAGENVLWNFSNLDSVGSYIRFSYDPATTPYGSKYPKANFCERSIIDASDFYAYALVTPDSVTQIGSAGTLGDSSVYYEPITSRYPITYLSSQTDTCIYSLFTHSKIELRNYMRQNIHCDAYRTLITPAGTFNNVIRHTLETYIIDSMFYKGNFINVDTFYERNYYWLSENYRPELLRMLFIQELNGVSKHSAIPYYYCKNPHFNSTTNTVNNQSKKIICNVYPIPANNTLYFKIFGISDFENILFSLYTSEGDLIITKKINNSYLILDLINISNGLYFYTIKNNNQNLFKDKLIISK